MKFHNEDKNIPFIFAFVGLILGLLFEKHSGWLYLSVAGFAFGLAWQARSQLQQLRKEFYALRRRLDEADTEYTAPPPAEPTMMAEKLEPMVIPEADTPADLQTEAVTIDTSVSEPAIPEAPPSPETTSPPPASEWKDQPQDTKPPKEPLPIDRAIQWVKDFLTTGNVMVKVGVTVLFFGVAFLIKYAAERNVLPIELRLAGVAIGGVVMLVLGWRLRYKKTAYALILQGGALGVLYLTVFSALRLYSLIPPTLAFGILFVFAAFSAALAILQNSRALAVLGVSGGFLAPILTSTGSGSHVALFSYYLVLNLGIFGIAWFRSWRMLNLVGFIFTFVVGTAWGVKYYTPAFFHNTEPFLIAFFLLYVAIAILFAFRQPVKLKGYVDSTLVFGVPIVAFGLQAGMVKDMEYMLAWSSLSMAVFYIGLASILWKRMNPDSRLLCEAFLALGVIFATLTIPFALDAQWTAASYALEGAAAVWVGTRQARLLPRLLGYILQPVAGVFLLSDHTYISREAVFILNGEYIGALIVAVSGLFVAWRLSTPVEQPDTAPVGSHPLKPMERGSMMLFLIWGLMWWYASGLHEVERYFSGDDELLAGMLFFTLSAILAHTIKLTINWHSIRFPTYILLPVLYLCLPIILIEEGAPFTDWYTGFWLLSLLAHFWILRAYDDALGKYLKALHVGAYWLIILLFMTEAIWQVDERVNGADTWQIIMVGLVPALMMVLMYRFGQAIRWPVAKHRELYQRTAIIPLAIFIWFMFVVLNLGSDGDAYPLQYIPMVNPLDLVLGVMLIVITYWQVSPLSFEDWHGKRWRYQPSQLLLALSIFLWLNTMWLRLAHHMWGIDFDLSDMTQSRLVQAGVSVLWGVTGLSCMIGGARLVKRKIWIAGAVVMAAVVVKLFMFDLANTGTVERIVSFMTVGILLLVVGYFSPVPPSEQKEHADEAS